MNRPAPPADLAPALPRFRAIFGWHDDPVAGGPSRARRRARLLLGLLVLGFVPLGLALLFLPGQVQAILTRQAHAHLTQAARDLSALAHNEMVRHLETARSLAKVETLAASIPRHNHGQLEPAGLAAVNRQAASLLQGLAAHHYQGLFLSGADGFLFAGVLRSGDARPYAGLDIRDRAYFTQARDTLRPVISDTLYSKIGEVPIIVIAIPVLDDAGAFAGLIGLSIEIDHLARLICDQRIGETGYPFAIDRRGLLVAHPDPARQFVLNITQVAGTNPLAVRMLRSEQAVQSYTSTTNVRKVAAFAPEPLSGWSIAASIEEEEFIRPVRRLRLILFTLVGACVLVAGTVAVTFAIGLETLDRALRETRASHEKLAEQAALLDQTSDGIIVRDLEHGILFWSDGAERMFGWTAAEAVGRRLNDLLHVPDLPGAEATHRVLETGAWLGQLEKTAKSGQIRTIDCRWTLLRDEAGRPKSILSTCTDITERKQMEAKFLRAQRLESIGTLAGGIAHDLNNLLSPIVIGLDMLRNSPRGADHDKILHYMDQSAARAATLVGQVLSFARGDEGARVSVHVRYVAREVESIIRSTFPRNITLRVDCTKDVWLVQADPTQLHQILLNLCVNARDAMPDGGQLSLSARNIADSAGLRAAHPDLAPGPCVLIEVSDTGTGIPRDLLDKIFDPFFTTKAPGKGTGLGLSTVLGLVRSHGGAVNVYSEPGRGSVFKIYLPVAPDNCPAATAPDGPAPGGHGELLLLVDDEPAILGTLRQTLEFAGYRVLAAADGAQAFALFHRHRREIALVLTDMMMPVMDGAALITALRRAEPALRIIAASGLNDHNNQIKAAETGIRHFLCKPYTTAALLAAVRRALDDDRGHSGSPFKSAPSPAPAR